MSRVGQLSLENVRIGFRNFEGREDQYNRNGNRSFAVFISDYGLAEQLANEGWNVKFPKPQEGPVDPDDFIPEPFIQVTVSMDNYPANVFMISNGKPTRLLGEEVNMLDWAEITNVDLVIRPYTWTVQGNSGIKAYLKAGYFTIETDQFAAKYGV